MNLVRANLKGCNLRGGMRMENVDLTEADLTDVRALCAIWREMVGIRAKR